MEPCSGLSRVSLRLLLFSPISEVRASKKDRIPPNVKDEPRPWLARAVLLRARIVTAMVVGSGALLGLFPNGGGMVKELFGGIFIVKNCVVVMADLLPRFGKHRVDLCGSPI